MYRSDRLAILAGLLALSIWTPPLYMVQAEEGPTQPDFPSIVSKQRPSLAPLASDVQALTLFTSSLEQTLGLADSPSPGRPAAGRKPQGQTDGQAQPERAEASLRLVSDLAAYNLAHTLRDAADKGPEALQAVTRAQSRQYGWLTEGQPSREPLRVAFRLAETQAGQTVEPPPGFSDYAAGLDRALPLVGTGESWLNLAEQTGPGGLSARLRAGAPPSSGETDQARLAQAYFQTRLHPVLTAHLIARTLRAEAEAERRGREAWLQLRTWQDRQRETRGLARLCGTWHWTIHNHQNHQDHKMVMAFDPPPASPQPAAPQPTAAQGTKPAKIVVLGEGVYLRWESAGGYQEDSLLFTGEGQRLEGSFVNSAGAWGSITGKRVAACKN